MAQTINTNISSLTAQRSASKIQDQLSTAMARLSSGLRINSAKDDAAGLAISERFTTQIRGLNQAARNANDGISLSQTAEGALAEVSNNLQRIRELSIQSANATNSATDRVALQQEVAQLIAEVDRVATQTEFNGLKLLDGSFTTKSFQIGANANQTIDVAGIASARATALGQGYGSTIAGTTLGATTGITAAGQFTLQVGTNTAIDVFAASGGAAIAGDAKSLANAINASGISGLTATAAATSSAAGTYTDSGAVTAGTATLTLNGIGISLNVTGVGGTDVANTLAAINQNSAATGVSAVANGGGGLTLTAADGRNITMAYANGTATVATASDLGLTGVAATTYGSYSLSYTGSSTITVGGSAAANVKGVANGATNAQATGTAVMNVDISTVAGANAAIRSMDNALDTVNSQRAALGAYQNRFSSTIASLQTTSENLSASRSRIQDADFAAETAALSRAQVLQQAATAMVAQANQLPQQVLQLLKG
ncbi:flagellin [Piscinibacter sp. XHJ-5]|uniref:flagellin N-terminal helical domain-containing protein n=1 Tax=Piscinibacter sp. XHJ-5 TaxID=3037797 RepID=UPI0024533E1B|nr:flagellin [Piscinibacter sp. XHJ-5]